MTTNQTIAQKELSQKIKALKTNFKEHLDGYIGHVTRDLEATVESLISDYGTDEEGPLDPNPSMTLNVEELKRAFLTGKRSVKDVIEEFWDHEGDSPFDRYEDLETELDKLEAEMDEQLKDDESEATAYAHNTLVEMAEKYRLSDSQYYQDELIKILENEYNLVLIVAPAKNP